MSEHGDYEGRKVCPIDGEYIPNLKMKKQSSPSDLEDLTKKFILYLETLKSICWSYLKDYLI